MSCTLKKKQQVIHDVLSELDCIPPTRWPAYWLAHMPLITDEEREEGLIPKELIEYHDEWKVKIFPPPIPDDPIAQVIVGIIVVAFLVFCGWIFYGIMKIFW